MIIKICEVHGELTAEKVGSGHRCKQCRSQWEKVNRVKSPEVYAAQSKRYKDRIGRKRITSKEIARRLKLDVNEYEEMFDKQSHKCAICGCEETKLARNGNPKRLSLDHNHETGKIRELLCNECNLGIGHAKENIEIIYAAIAYLNKFKEQK